jgi:hypothetical protein
MIAFKKYLKDPLFLLMNSRWGYWKNMIY